jgi:hypothetical protein
MTPTCDLWQKKDLGVLPASLRPLLRPTTPDSIVSHRFLRGPVRVAWFSADPIPWPCFNQGGKPGYILYGDLVRAVQQEPCGVVQQAWGVKRQTVVRWRKALGEGRKLNR